MHEGPSSSFNSFIKHVHDAGHNEVDLKNYRNYPIIENSIKRNERYQMKVMFNNCSLNGGYTVGFHLLPQTEE